MRYVLFGAAVLSVSFALAHTPAVRAYDDPAARPAFYAAKIKPIFEANCGRCHLGANHRGGLNMDTRESLLKGGHHGAAVVPGDPKNSLLVKLIRHEGPADDPMNMPPKADKLSDADIALVEQWVHAGAAMPPAPAEPAK